MDRNEVDKCVDDFHGFPSEIRDSIPSLMCATMEVIHGKYQAIMAHKKNTFAAAEIAKTESVSFSMHCKCGSS